MNSTKAEMRAKGTTMDSSWHLLVLEDNGSRPADEDVVSIGKPMLPVKPASDQVTNLRWLQRLQRSKQKKTQLQKTDLAEGLGRKKT